MEINELNKINVEVIETARDGLLIGKMSNLKGL